MMQCNLLRELQLCQTISISSRFFREFLLMESLHWARLLLIMVACRFHYRLIRMPLPVSRRLIMPE